VAKTLVPGRAAWIWTGLIAMGVLLAVRRMTATARSKVAGASTPNATEAGVERVTVVAPSAGVAETWAFGPASDAISAVLDAFPDDFSYSEYTETGFLVAFAGKAPVAALRSLEEPGIPFEVIEHVGHPLNEAEAETAALATQVKELTGGRLGFSVAPIPKAGVLEVMLSKGDDATVGRAVQSLAGSKSPSGLEVVLIMVDGRPRATS
jgi:hypothetical protein